MTTELEGRLGKAFELPREVRKYSPETGLLFYLEIKTYFLRMSCKGLHVVQSQGSRLLRPLNKNNKKGTRPKERVICCVFSLLCRTKLKKERNWNLKWHIYRGALSPLFTDRMKYLEELVLVERG